MPYSPEGVQRRVRPMVPDGSVQWRSDEIPSFDGTLYSSENCPAHIAAQALVYSIRRPSLLNRFSDGDYGILYRENGLAVKRFRYEDERYGRPVPSRLFGVDTLAVNLALQEGLKRQGPLVTVNPFSDQPTTYNYTTPELLAAFVPHGNELTPDGPRAVWIMTFVSGKVASLVDLPDEDERRDYLHQAVGLCGVDTPSVSLDDKFGNNTLVTPCQAGSPLINLVKHDVMARHEGVI